MSHPSFTKLAAAIAVIAAAGTAQATAYNPVTVEGATYYFSNSGSDWTLGIDIDGYSGGGTFLDNVAIKVFDHPTAASLPSHPSGGWVLTDFDTGLSADGCGNGSGGFSCATGHTHLTAGNGAGVVDYSFTFHVTGNSNPLLTPSIKARYVRFDEKKGEWEKAGTLVSETLTATPVPEPETYALMLVGLGVMGFVARRRAR